MLWGIADAVSDDVEDGEAGILAASQQHFHILVLDRRKVVAKLRTSMLIVCFRN